MSLEKITPTMFAVFAIGVSVVGLYLLRSRAGGTSPKKLKGWQTFLLFLLPILALVIFAVARYLIVFEPRFNLFEAHMSEYTSVTTQRPGAWYLRGKILPIDTRDNTVDLRVYNELPDPLRPITPEEVSMVLWLDCATRRVGTYTHGGIAYQWFCTATLVDLIAPAIIGESSFTGSKPPLVKSGSSNETGSFPSKEIIGFLKSLPAK